jgi:hypothetical protein
MYKLQKYRGKKVTRKKDSGLSLSRKSCRRRRRVKTKRCHIRRSTRRFIKYTIKRGNKRVRKNTQRGGDDDDDDDKDLIVVEALKNYILYKFKNSVMVMPKLFATVNGLVTKVKPGTIISSGLSQLDRKERLYIFTSGTIFYIARCAKEKGCPVRCTTCTTNDIYFNGQKRPLKDMNREVLRLDLIDVDAQSKEKDFNPIKYFTDNTGRMRFKSVDDNRHYVIDFTGDDLDLIRQSISNAQQLFTSMSAIKAFSLRFKQTGPTGTAVYEPSADDPEF